MHIFHKWEKIYTVWDSMFLGEKVEDRCNDYRRCKVCGKAQKTDGCYSKWFNLGEERAKVLNSKVVNDNGILKIKDQYV